MPSNGQTNIFNLGTVAPQIAAFFGDSPLYSTNTQTNPTYASAITLDTTAANTFFLTTTSAVGNTTLTPGTINPQGHQIQILIAGDASAVRTITFGTGFLTTGTLSTVQSKTVVIDLTSNGTAYVETGRTTTGV
jgi:hypothetical protein